MLKMKTRSSLHFSERTILQAAACSQHATHDVCSDLMPVFLSVISSSTSCDSYLLALYRELNLNYLSGGFNTAGVITYI